MKLCAVLTAIVLVIALAGTAHATVFLWTAPLLIDTATQYVRCSVTNVSTRPITVSVELFDGAGVSQGGFSVTLAPRASSTDFFSLSEVSVCKVAVPSAAYARASACISNFNSLNCLVEVDAR